MSGDSFFLLRNSADNQPVMVYEAHAEDCDGKLPLPLTDRALMRMKALQERLEETPHYREELTDSQAESYAKHIGQHFDNVAEVYPHLAGFVPHTRTLRFDEDSPLPRWNAMNVYFLRVSPAKKGGG